LYIKCLLTHIMCVLCSLAVKIKNSGFFRPIGDIFTALKNLKETNPNVIPHGWIWKFAFIIYCWHK